MVFGHTETKLLTTEGQEKLPNKNLFLTIYHFQFFALRQILRGYDLTKPLTVLEDGETGRGFRRGGVRRGERRHRQSKSRGEPRPILPSHRLAPVGRGKLIFLNGKIPESFLQFGIATSEV